MSRKGSSNGAAKLTETLVVWVRQRYVDGDRTAVLARKCHIKSPTMLRVVRGELWPHVPGAVPKGVLCGDGRHRPEVSRLVAEGVSLKDIKERLHISVSRIKRLRDRQYVAAPVPTEVA